MNFEQYSKEELIAKLNDYVDNHPYSILAKDLNAGVFNDFKKYSKSQLVLISQQYMKLKKERPSRSTMSMR